MTDDDTARATAPAVDRDALARKAAPALFRSLHGYDCYETEKATVRNAIGVHVRAVLDAVWDDLTALDDDARYRDVQPGETVHRIGSGVDAGTACKHCGASYWRCTEDVMRDPRDPESRDGCCDECRDCSGHETRSLPQIGGLLAEERQRGYRDGWAKAGERMRAPLTREERRTLHDGVCARHRDTAPGVYVCGPCEAAGDAAVERILAARSVPADDNGEGARDG